MPMVWVDPECDGHCERAQEVKRLEEAIAEAVRLLQSGETVAALQALTDDGSLPCKRPTAIERDYRQWQSGKLPGFTNYVRGAMQ